MSKTLLKSLIEKTFGVTISRTLSSALNKHADTALQRIRRWSPGDVIFDVGANDGRTLFRIRETLNAPRIFAFEPVRSTYETLVQRTAHLADVRCFPTALGAELGKKTIYLHDIDAMNSFSREWAEPTGTEIVDVRTVDDVMQEEGIDFVHFLKIDVEGHDFEVLKGARQALSSSRIAIIQVEVGVGQLEKAQPSLEEVRQHLAPMGYYLYGIFNQCHKRAAVPHSWSHDEALAYTPAVLAYCDALFIHAAL